MGGSRKNSACVNVIPSERPLRDPQFDTFWETDLGLIQSTAFILYQMDEQLNTVSVI